MLLLHCNLIRLTFYDKPENPRPRPRNWAGKAGVRYRKLGYIAFSVAIFKHRLRRSLQHRVYLSRQWVFALYAFSVAFCPQPVRWQCDVTASQAYSGIAHRKSTSTPSSHMYIRFRTCRTSSPCSVQYQFRISYPQICLPGQNSLSSQVIALSFSRIWVSDMILYS